jgi:5-methylcytosine-specific restriction endonuclease McrA
LISWQKAITLLFLRKVEALEHYEHKIRGGHNSIAQPAVVRLHRRVPWRKHGVRFSRRHVFQRDDHTCQYCAQHFVPRDLTFDHVMPRSRGGETSWTNIVTSCRRCNQRKGNRTPKEAGMKLLQRPYAPRWLPPHVRSHGVGGPHPLWEPYLWWAA